MRLIQSGGILNVAHGDALFVAKGIEVIEIGDVRKPDDCNVNRFL